MAGLRLQSIFNRFLLRRRKDSLFDGRPLVELPPKTIELHIVDFQDHEERLMYDMRLEQCQVRHGDIVAFAANHLLYLERLSSLNT